MYSPQIHEGIAVQRQADMRREAQRERLAAIAAANGPGKLARLGGVLRAWRTGAAASSRSLDVRQQGRLGQV